MARRSSRGKRFFLEFDFVPCTHEEAEVNGEEWLTGKAWDYTKQDYVHGHEAGGWRGNSMKTMKGYISRIKRLYAHQKPHNFRIFDYEAPDEPCGHVGQVYFQEN